jgi:putative transposase
MARPLRIEYPGAWYHVLNRGRRKEKIFFSAKDYAAFQDLLGRCYDLFELEIHAYSLMPNHYHLLVRTPRGNLSRAMRHLDGVYTQKVNRRHELEGALFKGRFKSILVEQESYWLELVRYIHRNPWKAGLEKKFGTHPWTSHIAYMKDQRAPKWLQREGILKEFGDRKREAQQALERFVRQGVPGGLEKELDGKKWPAILGTEPFLEQIKQKFISKKIKETEMPQIRAALRSVKGEDLSRMICRMLKIESEALGRSQRGAGNTARRAFVYVGRTYLKLSCGELRIHLGRISFAAVSKQFRLGEEEVRLRKGCSGLVEQLAKKLKLKVKT